MSVIYVDFKNKTTSHKMITFDQRCPEQGILEKRIFKNYYPKHVNPLVYDRIAARFADKRPQYGVIHQECGILKDGVFYIDSYGMGCTSNSDFNPYKKDLIKAEKWNRPIPFPVNLNKIYLALKCLDKTTKVRLGLKSDPLQWMDLRYKISQEIICMLNDLDLQYEIFTASDLVAHDDYLNLINKNLCTIVMRLPNIEESELRQKESGSPSLLRRKKAFNKLKKLDFNVKTYKKLTWEKI